MVNVKSTCLFAACCDGYLLLLLLLLQVNDGLLLDEKLSDYQAAFAAVDRDR
jgi:hypothetical protein